MTLSEHDIQGNIIRGYHKHAGAAYLFATVEDPDRARRFLNARVERVTTAEEWKDAAGPSSTLNVAFTFHGLETLGADIDAFTNVTDFTQGMYERAERQLGDSGANARENWETGLHHEADILLTVYGRDATVRTDELNRLKSTLEHSGLQEVYCQVADTLEGRREHFGFADGFSQPSIPGSRRLYPGEGVQERRPPRWRRARIGEFLLGHLDEDCVRPGAGHNILKNGTFMVWRKLKQDVSLFDAWVREQAGEGEAAQTWLKARIVGRWPDGTSLIRSPDGPPAPKPGADGPIGQRSTGERPDNTFTYGDDPDGVRCPLGAHIRRAYPRDALGFRTERTRRNRIIRRGMPYGPPWDPARPDDGDRGLIFVCFNASITRQFELIQRHWLMDGDTFGLADDRDFLTAPADPNGKMTIQGDTSRPPQFLWPQQQFVTVRGGYYLFVPGITALRQIVGPKSTRPQRRARPRTS